MILWQYFRGSWREPLRSYLKILVRDSIGTVIAVTGRSGFFIFTSIHE